MILNDAKTIILENEPVSKMYLGEKLIYPKSAPEPVLPDGYKKIVAIRNPTYHAGSVLDTGAKVIPGFTAELCGIFNYSTIGQNVKWFGLGYTGNYSNAKLVVGMSRGVSNFQYNNYPFVLVENQRTYADNPFNFSTLEDHIYLVKITTTPTVKLVFESQNSRDPSPQVITIDTDEQIDPSTDEKYEGVFFTINPYFVLYSVKIHSDISRDMIPVQRNSDGVCGMYDLLNQKFFESTNGYPYYGVFE